MLVSKFEEFCDVDGKKVREMCREHGMTISQVAKKLNMCATSLYGYLSDGRMPCRMAHQMMDAIWDGVPPFYFDIPQTGKHSMREPNMLKVMPDYYSNLMEARRQIDVALKKMETAKTEAPPHLDKDGCVYWDNLIKKND